MTDTATDYWDDPTDDSSGFLTHFIGKIESGYWSTLAAESEGKYTGDGSDTTRLYLKTTVLDILQKDFGGAPPEEITVGISIGGKWWTDPDSDHVVEHEDDSPDSPSPRKFKGDSGYGKMLSAVAGKDNPFGSTFKCDDGGEEVVINYGGVSKVFRDNNVTDARDARIWDGMIFEFRGLAFPYNGKHGAGKPFPCVYMGMDEGKIEAQLASNTNADKGNDMEVEIGKWVSLGAIQKGLAKTLATLESNAADHAAFMANATLLPAVSGNEVLMEAVSDPGNFTPF